MGCSDLTQVARIVNVSALAALPSLSEDLSNNGFVVGVQSGILSSLLTSVCCVCVCVLCVCVNVLYVVSCGVHAYVCVGLRLKTRMF